YVEGHPITEASKDASVEEKLRLFVKVCDAVQYAHRNLVVHRDLKPANILVNVEGEPRLLDFGIAKILGAPSDETATVARAYTPRYASPEQVLGLPVSTLTDVYSLGVLLYEILTGVLPYDLEGSDATALSAAITQIEPRRPSSRAPALPSDLDYIVLKSLRKEPEHRYGSVSDMASDIQNFLDGRPVLARPPSLRYLARKFARRHRTGVAAAALVLCAIALGIGATLWQSRVANLERDKAQAVSGFLQNLIQSGGPDREKFQSKGLDLKVVDLLDDSAQMLDKSSTGQPDVAIEMRRTQAASYLGLGAWDKARKQSELALAAARARYGERNLNTAKMYRTLGEALFKEENHRAAITNYRNALNIYAALAPNDPM